MSACKVVVAGAAGRMGQAVIEAIAAEPGAVLHAALEREGSPALGRDAGGVPVTSDALAAVLHADAIVDFTSPASSVELSGLAAQARIVHVVGTTGFSADDEAKIRAAARHATIVKSGNFSLGVNLLAGLAAKAAAALGEDWDVEIVEMHHRAKVDAPSGTALLLGEAAAKGRGRALAELRTPAREGHTGARVTGAIGFAALRGGTVVGDHDVILAGPHERVILSHRAESRAIFARGALRAAMWGRGKGPGLFSMGDVLGL